jgi:hypothetical protein
MTNTEKSSHPQHDPVDQLDRLRAIVPAVDPATLTGADCRALLDLAQASMEARGIE